tara:strand:+ start:3835 stop:4128 length:294 start_codon:yes stop_codon:yes gene_type:complete
MIKVKKALLKQSEDTLKVFDKISNLFLSAKSLDTIYKKIPKLLSKFFLCPIVAIELYDEQSKEMVVVGAEGIPSKKPLPICLPMIAMPSLEPFPEMA